MLLIEQRPITGIAPYQNNPRENDPAVEAEIRGHRTHFLSAYFFRPAFRGRRMR